MRKGDCSMRINLLLFATNDLNSFDGYFPNKASKYCSIVNCHIYYKFSYINY